MENFIFCAVCCYVRENSVCIFSSISQIIHVELFEELFELLELLFCFKNTRALLFALFLIKVY